MQKVLGLLVVFAVGLVAFVELLHPARALAAGYM